MLPILANILRFLAGAAIFTATEAVLNKLIDKDENSMIDELISAFIATGFIQKSDAAKVAQAAKKVPPIQGINSATDAANYLEELIARTEAKANLNRQLGGYLPLAVKLARNIANFLKKNPLLQAKKAALLVSVVSAILWAPTTIANILDHGVFNPKQANAILDALGVPKRFRWPEEPGGIGDKRSGGSGATGATRTTGEPLPTALPTLTKTKSAKPKIFIGTIWGDRVADAPEFVRKLDDEITDEEDLVDDVITNLTRWVAALPGRLTYEIQVKHNPYDFDNTRKLGYWVVLSLYHNGRTGKRIYLDDILLGPIDPVKYWPEERTTHTLRLTIPKEFAPAILKPGFAAGMPLEVITDEGEKVHIFGGGAQSEGGDEFERALTAALGEGAGAAAQGGAGTGTSAAPQLTPQQESVIREAARDLVAQQSTEGTPPPILPGIGRIVDQIIEEQRQRPSVPTTAPTGAQPTPPEATTPPTSTPSTPVPATAPPRGFGLAPGVKAVVDTGGSCLNVRDRPSTSGKVMTCWKDGTEVQIITGAGSADGFFWWRVRGPFAEGFVADDFLRKIG